MFSVVIKKFFSSILGEKEYNKLRNKYWKTKQSNTMLKKYGVDNVFKSERFKINNPMFNEVYKKKRQETMMKRYGVKEPNQNKDIKAKMLKTWKQTNKEKYGFESPMQNPKIAKKSAKKRQETMLKKYGAKNTFEIESIRNSILEKRKKMGSFTTSRAENTLYKMLVDKFGKDDVFRNIRVDERYPFNCDFYIKSRDLFIELNGDKCHNYGWFDENNLEHQSILNFWKKRSEELEAKSGKKSRYRSFIKTWSETDVKKRNYAKNNNLNYIVFWDGESEKVDNTYVSRLSDAKDWFNSGCPDSKDWNPKNTY